MREDIIPSLDYIYVETYILFLHFFCFGVLFAQKQIWSYVTKNAKKLYTINSCPEQNDDQNPNSTDRSSAA